MSAPRRTAVVTSDADEAAAGFEAAFPGLRVRVEHGRDPFTFSYGDLRTSRFALHRMRCSGVLRADGPLPESVAVGRRRSGRVAIRRGDRPVDTTSPYLRPIAPSEFEMGDGEVTLVTIEPAALTDYLERSGERPSVPQLLASRPDRAALTLVMDHAMAHLDQGGSLATPAAEEELLDLLCWSLIRAFEDPWAETGRAGSGSAAVRRAVHYLEEHADGSVALPALADAARVSVRGLHLAFRRELGTTPHRWLRDLRLDRARLDLLRGNGSVAEVAARHGMHHGGRFAAEYRARFGELPGTTARG